jgi:polyisoprenoid-binding protein YceI
MKACVRLFLFLVSLSWSWAAQAKLYKIDPAHSSVGFKIRHLVGRVPGQFTEFSGTIDLDDKDLSKSSVQARIQAASIDTRIQKRDKHLRSADFFDVERYPVLSFTSSKVTPSREADKATLEGSLEMHGLTKTVSLELESLGVGEMMGHKRVGFEAHGKLLRSDFGITWNKSVVGGLLLGDEVEVDIQIEAEEAK